MCIHVVSSNWAPKPEVSLQHHSSSMAAKAPLKKVTQALDAKVDDMQAGVSNMAECALSTELHYINNELAKNPPLALTVALLVGGCALPQLFMHGSQRSGPNDKLQEDA